ncbi:MAG TPA: peptidase M3 [Myxococcaceae bacterium]|nr:peptidase M3 [Myxococcaceae bacterium]
MALSLAALRNRIEAYLAKLGSLEYQRRAGLSPELSISQHQAFFPELGLPDTFASVREAAENQSLEESARRRFRLLLEFLAGQVEQTAAAAALEAILATESTAEIAFGEEHLPLGEALTQLRREPDRARRDRLDQSIGHFFWENQGLYARRWDAAEQATRVLGYGSYLAMQDELSGYSASALAADADVLLQHTDDAYREVLDYALKKIDPTLRPFPPGAAADHDLQLAVSAPWMSSQFPPEELMPAVTRCLGEMGLPPHANGRILVDVDERPGKATFAFAALLQVPDDVRLIVARGAGPDHYRALLREFGRAQHAANASKSAPVEERRLGDESLSEGTAFLFEHLLLDEAWLRRYLRLSRAAAREAARIAALNSLSRLRRTAALLAYEIQLYERGPSRPLAEEYQSRLSSALMVTVQRGHYLREPEPQLFSGRQLRAWALEVRLRAFLLERFNEDFWRNPASGRWLRDLFSKGRRDDAESLSQELAGEPLSLEDAAARLIRVMMA